MPEGPSLIILKDNVQDFEGQVVQEVSGNRKIDLQRMLHKKLIRFRTFGKQFIMQFEDFSLRIHFLLFGTYRINERKETPARVSLKFKNGEINFYGCSARYIEEDPDDIYDWSADVMSEQWDENNALKKLKLKPEMQVCDALLDQDIFAGVGNIIKNEVLYRIYLHPENEIRMLPEGKLLELVREARNYSFDFFRWKKEFVLKKNWLAHTKKICKRCDLPFKKQHLGKTNRRTFFCENCQVKYS